MARARNIKPGFFKNEDLAECSPWSRLCFAGLWTLADREGRLEDRAKRIKGELFAFDSIEVEPLLQELARHGFIVRYEVDGQRFIQVSKFLEHQTPHYTEKNSTIKPPELKESTPPQRPPDSKKTPGVKAASRGGQNPLNPDSLIPDSLIPESKDQAHAAIPQPQARAPDPETEGHKPTPAGLVCRSLKAQGMAAVNPGDPRLTALVEQGATLAEFEGIGAEAVAKGKGFAWVLAVLTARRAEAAALTLAPPVPASPAPSVSPQVEATRRMLADRKPLTPAEIEANREAVGKIRERLKGITQ